MIGRLNHVAIAVPDLEAAAAQYRGTLGAKVGAPQPEPDHGVTVVFIELPNTKIELLHPLGEAPPSSGSWKRTPRAASTTSAMRSTTFWPRATI
jgi:methylmalonyl-CoA/ethylmalonyl-CoA epimerase